MSKCTICSRELNIKDDPLSGDCGGDCWGCIGEIEARMQYQPSVEIVHSEIEQGIRPKPVGWVSKA